VFTTRDGGKNWYRLADAGVRAVDIAMGMVGEKKALFALTSNGVDLFDGEKWTNVKDAPTSGRTIAMRGDRIFIAGAQGVRAGTVDADLHWQTAEAPDAQYAVVYGGARDGGQMLFLASRQQREILVGDSAGSDWLELTLPSPNTDVASISPDPYSPDRYYVATLGEGIFVYEGRMRRYTAPAEKKAALGSTGGK
jgi:photosystem II stability/assembly factor-like uncharacterized protein